MTPKAHMRVSLLVFSLCQVGWLVRAVCLDAGFRLADHLSEWSWYRLLAVSIISATSALLAGMRMSE